MSMKRGQLEIFSELNEIAGPGGHQRLEPQAMDVLELLASEPGKVWLREELLDSAWPGRVVSDATLTGVISRLRAALTAANVTDVCIETRSKRGYRLVLTGAAPGGSTFNRSPRRMLLVASAGVVLALAAALFIVPRQTLEGVSLVFDITLPSGEHVEPVIWLKEASEGSIHGQGLDIRVVPHLESGGLVRLQFEAASLAHWAAFEHVLALGAENQFTLVSDVSSKPYRVRFRLERGKPAMLAERHHD